MPSVIIAIIIYLSANRTHNVFEVFQKNAI